MSNKVVPSQTKIDEKIGDQPKIEDGNFVGIDLLRRTEIISFNKPDVEIFNASILYEVTSENDQRLFFVMRTSPSMFQSQCDIELIDSEGNPAFRLINPKKNPSKVIVRIGDKTIGSVIQTNSICLSPKFEIRGSDKKEIAVILTHRDPCVMLPPCCFGVSFGMFAVVRRLDPNGKKLTEESLLGTISRDLYDDGKDALTGLLEVHFTDLELDAHIKCLLIAAGIFIDFAVFSANKEGGKSPTKMLCIIGATLIILLVSAILLYLFLSK